MRRLLFFLLIFSCNHNQVTKTTAPEGGGKKTTTTKIVGCDMSSDEAIQKLYMKLTKKRLTDQDCIQRPSSFPGLARVGTYRTDLGGCRYDTFIFQCELVGNDIAANAMAAAGWATATPERRQQLALDWLVQLEGIRPLTQSDTGDVDNFKSQGKLLPSPEFEAVADSLKVRYWVKITNRNSPEILYKRHEITFGANGVKTGETIISSFSFTPA